MTGEGAAPASPAAPAVTEPSPGPMGFLERLTDRMNPIFVREVQQAMNSKAFIGVLALSLIGVVSIALIVAAEGKPGASEGTEALVGTLMVLTPILMLVVPLLAFFGMRQEVSGGTVEHLLLSRMTPGAIVRGKLLAFVVQFVLYLAVFAPLIALTYLLRGVDIPTITILLGMAFLFGLGACTLAVACGAMCRIGVVQVIPFLIIFPALIGLTIPMVTGMPFAVWSLSRALLEPDFWPTMLALVWPCVMGLILFGMVGTSSLAHPYENRSTRFRVFAFIGMAASYGWMAYMATRLSTGSGLGVDIDAPELAAVSAIFLLPFWLLAVTEEQTLSPRVLTRVPRLFLFAWLSVPFLPGRGRGLMFTLLLAAFVLASGFYLPRRVAGVEASTFHMAQAAIAWLYVLFYAGLGSLVRGRLGPGPARNWVARGIVPMVLVAGTLLPLLADILVSGRARGWGWHHLLNPFFTINSRRAGHLGYLSTGEVMPVLLMMVAVVWILNVRSIARSITEVHRAAAARRSRAG